MIEAIDTGLWLEPETTFANGAMPHSSDLVRVLAVTCMNGENTRVRCTTHHGETFECQWSWLRVYWRYAEDATIPDGPIDSGAQS